MTEYRIKEERVADEEEFWNTLDMQKPTYHIVYKVQMKRFGVWLTIKEFTDDDMWWALANASNLLDELNKEL